MDQTDPQTQPDSGEAHELRIDGIGCRNCHLLSLEVIRLQGAIAKLAKNMEFPKTF